MPRSPRSTGTVGSASGTSDQPPPSGSTAAASAAVTSATPPGSVPTFTLSGCATSQTEVAQTLQRLRLIDGVSNVTLQSSTKPSCERRHHRWRCAAGAPAVNTSFTVEVTFDPLPRRV